jgi:hypothetical protein
MEPIVTIETPLLLTRSCSRSETRINQPYYVKSTILILILTVKNDQDLQTTVS